MIFLFILLFGVLFLFFNVRQIAPGNKGSIIAGALVVILPICFFFREMLWASYGVAVLSVWLCEALLVYVAWSIVRGIIRLVRRKPLPVRISVIVARALLLVSVVLTVVFCIVGKGNDANYEIKRMSVTVPGSEALIYRYLPVSTDTGVVAALNPDKDAIVFHFPSKNAKKDTSYEFVKSLPIPGKSLRVVFMSDLHISPLFDKAKLDRIYWDVKKAHPDYLILGGDISDVGDSALISEGYDELFGKLAAAAQKGAFAISGNHEGYMERDNANVLSVLKKAGFVVLEDSTLCNDGFCFTGRIDFQMAHSRDVERRALAELIPPEKMRCDSAMSLLGKRFVHPKSKVLFNQDKYNYCVAHKNPWILMDHQPKGIEDGHVGRLPDFALSGHTHAGQFFPGTAIINFVWRLAYGLGELDGVKWLVSSGIGCWGPRVRIGSHSEMWIIQIEQKK